MLRINARGRNAGETQHKIDLVLGAIRSGERACVIARDRASAEAFANRLRRSGLVVTQAGNILEINPADTLH